mmetsp:Transcript_1963/g.3528  ORF Transcript_1963/g.3528 Transcript_1963/m.3528 type:complete len:300 (-) Transcript_1963:336-1235(-)
MGNLVTTIVTGAVGLVGAAVAAVFIFQERLLYLPDVPTREYEDRPDSFDLPYEDVDSVVTSDGVRLHGWFIPQRNDPMAARCTLLYFHGNAGNIGHRLTHARRLYDGVGCNLLLMSYRGYGASEGKPTQTGFEKDAVAALDYLHGRADIDRSKIFVFGSSIGGAVAISLAARQGQQLRGVLLENTFLSINHMMDEVFPKFFAFLKPLNRNRWDSEKDIAHLQHPILFLSGLQDELVPPSHMKQLYTTSKASSYRKLEVFATGRHNDTWMRGGVAYYAAIREFVNHVNSDLPGWCPTKTS